MPTPDIPTFTIQEEAHLIATDPLPAADLLRRAATRLRTNASRATKGPWNAHPDGLVWPDHMGDPVSGSAEIEDAEYIAMMHPPVPLALADWLTRIADEFDKHTYLELPECPGCAEPAVCRGHDWVRMCALCIRDVEVPGDKDPCRCWAEPITVAREILREFEGGETT